MKIDLIKDAISNFTVDVVEKYDETELNKWECLKTFQDHWNLSTDDLPAMFDKALSSQHSGRLWGGSKYSAKSMMINFFNLNPDYVIAAFNDLFDRSKDITLRMERFKLHCDELLDSLPSGSRKETSHHHDRYMTSLYLAFRYPDQYCLYNYDAFRKAMIIIQTKNVPESYETDRFFKISNILTTFLSKDERLQASLKAQLNRPTYFKDPSQLVTYDFYCYLAK